MILAADRHLGVENPKMVFILGCVGFTLNILSALFLHGESEPSVWEKNWSDVVIQNTITAGMDTAMDTAIAMKTTVPI